ncbi:DUF924 family protein [Afifella sp. IM 167]|uniref:DUF924 family protein n=1 Tax=Afifella sp. IM 167 TaxID=2033586 RepID=UPI001CD020CA|nr:DUF924 family protein [Afifella sp. IM 167]MBZ8132929.1 hypothetical protein [Afifella sp. IM 167]
METRPADIVSFWREAGPEKWFSASDEFDAEIRSRFAEAYRAAADGELDGWAEKPEGALALVLLLDQFSRNLHRGSAAAYRADAKARRIADQALADGFDGKVPPDVKKFFVMPFMHSESLADQDRCVVLSHALADGDATLPYALRHREIIRRFARFPHRNEALGRRSSAAEKAYLEGGGFKG